MSTWDKVRHIPSQTWLNLFICAVAVVLVVHVWRALTQFNAFAPWILAVVVSSTIMAYWTYERTEPRFLTPVVDKLVLILPTRAKHEADLEKLRKGRDADIH